MAQLVNELHNIMLVQGSIPRLALFFSRIIEIEERKELFI